MGSKSLGGSPSIRIHHRDRPKVAEIDIFRNDAFPVHADLCDDKADFDKSKPGGYFTKELYNPENQEAMREAILKEIALEAAAGSSTASPKRLVNAGTKNKLGTFLERFKSSQGQKEDEYVLGFYRTEEKHRSHYIQARKRVKGNSVQRY